MFAKAVSKSPRLVARSRTTHKFAVGQEVSFSPDRDQQRQYTKGELLRIVRLLRSSRRAPVPRQERGGWARACSAGRPACRWVITEIGIGRGAKEIHWLTAKGNQC